MLFYNKTLHFLNLLYYYTHHVGETCKLDIDGEYNNHTTTMATKRTS